MGRTPFVLYDSHCHYQLCRGDWRAKIRMVTQRFDSAHLRFGAALNAVTPEDWEPIQQLCKLYATGRHSLIPNFGIHPWYASKALKEHPDWKQRLNTHLRQCPEAGVGETGLDRSPRALEQSSWSDQTEIFREQIQLAVTHQRPISIHCVRAHTQMLEILSQYFTASAPHTPGIVLHSFSGSSEFVRQCLPLNCYFSLAGPSVAPSRRTVKVLNTIPLERLLVESDAPDQAPPLAVLHEFYQECSGATLGEPSVPLPHTEPPSFDAPLAVLAWYRTLFFDLATPAWKEALQAPLPSTPAPRLENELCVLFYVIFSYCRLRGISAPADILHVFETVAFNAQTIFSVGACRSYEQE